MHWTAHVRNASMTVAIGLCIATSPAPAQVPGGQQGLPSRDAVSLQPGDVLRISVWPDADLSGEFVVEETGNVYLPFLGSVQVTGLSIGQLRNQLRAGYEEVIKEPVVTITPLYRIAVMGEVGGPGVYQIDPTTDVLEAILMAGGFRERAKQDEVQIVRAGEVINLDVQRALEQGADLSALTLRSGDRIIVPRRGRGFNVRTAFSVLNTLTTTALLIERFVTDRN